MKKKNKQGMVDMDAFRRICRMSFDKFKEYPNAEVRSGKNGEHIFIDRGGDILVVAHLDSVQKSRSFVTLRFMGETYVYCPVLDDRVGAYVALELLPKLGVVCDVLLTDNEEIGRSTASDFKTEKQYNWIAQWDRGGTDMVMYDYETKDLANIMESYGWDVGFGSYSDICDLQDLGCKAFNFSAAYYNYHSINAFVIVEELEESIKKFLLFYNDYKGKHLPHTRVIRYTAYTNSSSYVSSWWASYYNQKYGHIDHSVLCGECGSKYFESLDEVDYWYTEAFGICKGCYSSIIKTVLCETCDKEYDIDDPNSRHIAKFGNCMNCSNVQMKYGSVECGLCGQLFNPATEMDEISLIESIGMCSYCDDYVESQYYKGLLRKNLLKANNSDDKKKPN